MSFISASCGHIAHFLAKHAVLASICAALLSPSCHATGQPRTYEELEELCRTKLQSADLVDGPATLIQAGYGEFIQDYLRNVKMIKWLTSSRYNHHVLYLALASKKYDAYQTEVVEWLKSWQQPPPVLPEEPTDAALREFVVKYWEKVPGIQSVYRDAGAAASYIALSVIGGPVAEQIISQAVDYETGGMPAQIRASLEWLEEEMQGRVRASLALAAHFMGDSQRALQILDGVRPERFTLSADLLAATKAFVESDIGKSKGIRPEEKLGVFCVLADGTGAQDLVPFGPWQYIEMLVGLGYLILDADGDVVTQGLPFQVSLDRAQLYEHFCYRDEIEPELKYTGAFCRMVAWLGDRSQEEVLHIVKNGSPELVERMDAEFALILLGEDMEPTIARSILVRRNSSSWKAWVKDNTIGRLASFLRREEWAPMEGLYADSECKRVVRALGVVGAPEDIGLLLPLTEPYGYSHLTSAAIIRIIRRHDLSGAYPQGK